MKRSNLQIRGFSKLSKSAKITWLTEQHLSNPEQGQALIASYNHADEAVQKRHDEFIENTVANYYLPLGVAPNFLINGQVYTVPMAIEESSVVGGGQICPVLDGPRRIRFYGSFDDQNWAHSLHLHWRRLSPHHLGRAHSA